MLGCCDALHARLRKHRRLDDAEEIADEAVEGTALREKALEVATKAAPATAAAAVLDKRVIVFNLFGFSRRAVSQLLLDDAQASPVLRRRYE